MHTLLNTKRSSTTLPESAVGLMILILLLHYFLQQNFLAEASTGCKLFQTNMLKLLQRYAHRFENGMHDFADISQLLDGATLEVFVDFLYELFIQQF